MTKETKLPLVSPSRQIREQFAKPDDYYLSYELGKAVQELPPLYTRLVGVTLSLAVFGAIAWAGLSKVDEVAVAPGEIIPSEQVIPVRWDGGGIIQNIWVKEGQQVRKGDNLVELESKSSQAEVVRLKKQADLIDADIKRATKATAESYRARIREAEIELLRSRDNLKAAQRDVNRLRGLVGAIPRQDYEHAQDKAKDLVKTIASQQTKIRQLQEDYKSGNLSQLNQRREELETVKRQLEQAIVQRNRQKIQAPMSGKVYNININQGQSTVQSGEELLSILPDGKEPLLEVYLPNQYRGFVDAGMKAKIKVDAFPYQEFGIIDGTVVYVSPNAIAKDKSSGKKVFPAKIKLNKLAVRARGQNKQLTPGMTASGEIVMRQKTILSLLIEPITRKFDEVFSVK
ncbi:MAG: HlyD family efflux transporter periplasmic adaptor subunit [Methylacidiphilales bacterium]|nr:HlyD family efflux transporter periplasmic adaptor subunit [Candidatus Methylacidiphilales bacterium]NJR18672.1 HlyD family efflux transporter periplasmic adaptor subunit [Calothrix sp. CSU_2_0]